MNAGRVVQCLRVYWKIKQQVKKKDYEPFFWNSSPNTLKIQDIIHSSRLNIIRTTVTTLNSAIKEKLVSATHMVFEA